MRMLIVTCLALVAVFALYEAKDGVEKLGKREIHERFVSCEKFCEELASDRPFSQISTNYVIQDNEVKIRILYTKIPEEEWTEQAE